jgi:hypothetical protein
MGKSWPGKVAFIQTLKAAVAEFKRKGGRLDFAPGKKGGHLSNRWLKISTIPEPLGKESAEVTQKSPRNGKRLSSERPPAA